MIKIAIIGGGPASISLCIELKKQLVGLEKYTEILVFEKNDHIGHGFPYTTHSEGCLLNLPKEVMEPLSGETNQFVKWLRQNELDSESAFPSRHLFGQYLEYRAIAAQLEAESQGLTIRYLINHEVLDITRTSTGLFQVITTKEDYDVNSIILSLGHMPPATFCELKELNGYIHNPLECNDFKAMGTGEPVTIIGSRLTAIDVALKLKQANHTGKLTMVSRSGLLPTVLGKAIPPYSLKHLTLEALAEKTKNKYLTLEELATLFWQEVMSLSNLGHLHTFPKSSKDISAIDWINNEIKEAEKGARSWQQLLFALYPLTPHIWSMVSAEEQRLFMDQFYSLFITYLAAFPLENAYKIKELLFSNQLSIYGGFNEIIVENNQFEVRYQEDKTIKSNWLINATGPSYDAATLPLLKKMLVKGIITKHPLGGIQLKRESLKAVDREGQALLPLYGIGEITKGNYFLTTDLGCVTAQAKKIAIALVQTVNSWRLEEKII